MMAEQRSRPSLFEEDAGLDLSAFAPKPAPPPAPAPETIRQLSEEGGFPSRSPTRAAPVPTLPATKAARSGGTALLGARITPRAHDRYHQLVAAEHARFEAGEIGHKPTLGEIVERALAALEREIAGQGRGA